MAVSLPTNLAADSAAKLKIRKIASEAITQFELVRLDSSTHASLASIASYDDAKVVGIALEAAALGAEFDILVFGILEDPAFAFPLHDPLFLQSDSSVSNIVPIPVVGEFLTRVGESLGVGAIFLKLEEPSEIL